MRTNIEIDDDLMIHALQVSGLKTKRAVVEEALKVLICLHEQGQIENLFGALHWEGNLTALREDRFDDFG